MFGRELRQDREAREWSLRELAQRVHYSVSHLSNVENGTKAPTTELATACDLALDTGTKYSDLVTLAKRSPDAHPNPPAELPAVVDLVGQTEALAELDRLLDWSRPQPGPGLFAVDGPAGVGKTTLALSWAHRVKHHFPDGAFFADLRGCSDDGPPLEPEAVLEDFLWTLGVRDEAMPTTPSAKVGLWRSLLAGTRTLVVLDNANSPEQVRPLIPGAWECLVLITSRRRLSGLAIHDDARCLTLDMLAEHESLQLLEQVVGVERVSAEHEAAKAIVRHCGRLPLAVRLAGERAAGSPHLRLADLAEGLSAVDDRLDLLSLQGEQDSVRAALSRSCRLLTEQQARVFRLVALHPGPDFDLDAAAALCGLEAREIRQALGALVSLHLLTEAQPGRYTKHDLVKAYAAEQARALPAEETAAAVARMLDWYLRATYHHAHALAPTTQDPELPPPVPGVPTVGGEVSHEQARAWFAASLPTLTGCVHLSAERGLTEVAWKLPVGLWNYLVLARDWDSWVTTHTIGLRAARAARDRFGTAWVLHNLANAHRERGETELAARLWNEALELRRQIGDSTGQAWTLLGLGRLSLDVGKARQAVELFTEAGALFTRLRHFEGTAATLAVRGQAHHQQGDVSQALEDLERALELVRDLGDQRTEAFTLLQLGTVKQARGEHARALEDFAAATAIRQEIGDATGLAEALLAAGHSHQGQGNAELAEQARQQAAVITDSLNVPDQRKGTFSSGSTPR